MKDSASLLNEIGPEIWVAEGPVLTALVGFSYPTRMTVIRLASGELVLWSPVAYSSALHDALRALGRLRYLVAPNTLHDSFIDQWIGAAPQAALLAPPRLAEMRGDLPFSGALEEPPAAWAGEISLQVIEGNAITDEVVAFHHPSGTVIFTDLIQQFPEDWFTGWRRQVAKLDLMTGAHPEVPRKFRSTFGDRKAARRALETVLAWPAERLVMAHGPVIHSGAQAEIARAFRWLMRE
ncbi:DUF4336 domain-containing protein [Roseivivax sp. GX 12232]|uniref:DUF4336 domain-containing protein n=1 Tax=Roseivivax sp. GX 12232 TaxID=2900547 RepID=UPI001E5C4EC9|nr:DUF4336 domain-containing protein [Roseivivax sp. GX 12232]